MRQGPPVRVAVIAVAIMIGLLTPVILDLRVPLEHPPAPSPVRDVVATVKGSNSQDWGGYVVYAGTTTVTVAAGSWVVPNITTTCGLSRTTQEAQLWTGLGGWNATGSEEAGVTLECLHGQASYQTFYAYYQNGTVVDGSDFGEVTIHPGNDVSVVVQYVPTDQMEFTLTDNSTGKTQTITLVLVPSQVSLDSADWLLGTLANESYRYPLPPDMGSLHSGYDWTGNDATDRATIGGSSGALGSWGTIFNVTLDNKTTKEVLFEPIGGIVESGTSFTLGPIGAAVPTYAGGSIWAGYTVDSPTDSVTYAEMSWTQPGFQSSCSSENVTTAAIWVGIDDQGTPTSPLEQVGTTMSCDHGTVGSAAVADNYSATTGNPYGGTYKEASWFPGVGDKIVATVAYHDGTFELSIEDLTRIEDYNERDYLFMNDSNSSHSARDNVNWIVENDCTLIDNCGLANFGMLETGSNYTSVGNTDNATVAGYSGPVGAFPSLEYWDIYNVSDNHYLATVPDGVGLNEDSFVVQWRAST